MIEPLENVRELSDEEYQALTSEAETVPLEVVDDRVWELGRQIWELALQGDNRDQMSLKLDIPIEMIDETLNKYRTRLGLSIENYRLLDNERCDRLIAYWLPIAMSGAITIERIRSGEAFTEQDFDIPLKASTFCISAMERRLKILTGSANLGAILPGGESDKPYAERNIVIWLREVLPSIEKITQELEIPSPNGASHNGA